MNTGLTIPKAQFKAMCAVLIATAVPSANADRKDNPYRVPLSTLVSGVATGFSEEALIAAIKCVSP